MMIMFLLGAVLPGCTNTKTPLTPSNDPSAARTGSETRQCLGLWQFTIDPVQKSLDCVPLRAIQTHMNALTFMEPPAGVLLKIDQVVSVVSGEITVDIALTHPYPGANFAAAFDVCGILISHGSLYFPFSDKLYFPGDDQVRLLNPDGYTRWWNPVEFPYDAAHPSKGYKDGLLGKKNSVANFDATLNGFKYFASDLSSPDAPLSELDKNMRGAFVPGTTCVRRYRIAFNPGNLVFNYAVDANWAPPTGPIPIDIPADFPLSANRAEAYYIELHNIKNTLTYDSGSGTTTGSATMSVWVYDWFDAGKNTVCAYSQNDELMGMCTPFPVGGDSTYSVFNVDLLPMALTSTDDILVWFEVSSKEKGYQGAIPGDLEAVFYQKMITVAGG